MKALSLLAMLSASVAGQAFAIETGPVAAEPAAKTFTVGSIKVTALRDAQFVAANDGKLFGVGIEPEAVSKVLKAAGQPTDRVTLSVDGLLVQSGNQKILIDTGLGPSAHGVLLESLAKAGSKPEDISDVLITHVHGDHIGGLVKADGSLAFANATIRISAPDWTWLQTQPKMAALVTAITPKVKIFAPGDSVAEGITSVPIKGHTPGHVGYQIVSGKKRLLDIGDTAHSSIVSLAEPDWAMGFDNDAAEGKVSRREILSQLAKDHELIFAPHFPFPGVGHIVAVGDHFAWKPQK
ncbi:MBL fold metallo-hydrolase [Rhizobium tumorigenes]|uniref:MBL fold metallo-hydrolase n=1 Tax=Rhizobium tumorigenes TaxID=2041385 RepID=A0AAF1KG13_9HYPH|nr:MBL fold metallo-hydrolase [Rhizobium tumorigenes]WFR99316.1 MBL fold metallo-hydrolase [Rhizobium tumorigenes]